MPRTRSDGRPTRGRGAALALAAATLALPVAAASAGDVVTFVITLDGSQEIPAADTPATGNGNATLDLGSNLFSWDITFAGLSAAQTAAHFHGAAPECDSAGVRIALPLGSPIVGSQVLTPSQVNEVLDGLWYVNVHTTAHPGGEIRGQVNPGPVDDALPDIQPSAITVALEVVADGLTAPNWGTAAPGDPGRLFVTDQSGILWAVDLATGAKSVFLDTSDLLVELGVFGPGSFDERGLLGVGFHPDYQKNGLVYTYTSQPADAPADFSTIPAGADPHHQTVITEWNVPIPGDPTSVVDPGSARVLLRIDQPQFNHNAGAIAFGPDGMLHIALGDGGGGDDKDGQVSLGAPMIGHGCAGNGQDTSTVLGSMLRIDPLGSNSANGEYGNPPDNPFVGGPGLDEIHSYGLRNPFRFSFDMVTGDMYIADVGQNHIEEINIGASGANYGWRAKEGSLSFAPNGNMSGYAMSSPIPAPPGAVDPIAEYDHDDGIAVVGGFVYRGTRFGTLSGRYVFGEFALSFDNDGRLFMLTPGNEIRELQIAGQPAGLGLFLLGFGQDAAGEVYAMVNSTGVPFESTGMVVRLVPLAGDVNNDGTVDVTDLVEVILAWGPCSAPPAACPADIDGNGAVDVQDLVEVILNWG